MTLHFDSRDLFRCVRLGWSGKKIWVGLLGLLVSWLGYSAFLLLAYFRAGISISVLWHRYGLFPGAKLGAFDLLGTVIHGLGMVWVLAVLLVAMCMICKITFQQLRGDGFYSVGDAWAFAKAHWTSVLLGPLGVLAMFVAAVLVGIVVGMVGHWVPVLGEFFFALGFIPLFFVAILAVFMAVVFLVSLSMSPAIVGTVGEDALEVVIQSFSLLWTQPWRLFLYLTWVKVSAWIGLLVVGILSMAAMGLITWSSGLFMQVKLANMFEVATRYLPFVPQQWDMVMANLPMAEGLSGSEHWAGRILGLMFVFVTGVVVSYGLAAQASGATLIYVILRRCKDRENMLDWDVPDWGHVDRVDEDAAETVEADADPLNEDEDDSTDTQKA